MPTLKLLAIMAVGTLLLTTGAYFYGRWDGSAACELRHAEAQAEQEKKAKKTYAKIKRNAPTDVDKPAAIKWLSERTRQ